MIQAVIFDLDGTVLDNETEWELVFQEVAHQNNLKLDRHTPGIGARNNWKKIVTDTELIEKLTLETRDLYREKFAPDTRLRDGIVELVDTIKLEGMRTGLATGSIWSVVEEELEQLDLYLAFDVTTTGDELIAQKPDPEIYNLTIDKLGVTPTETIIIEDSISGIIAAVESGTRVIGVVNEFAGATELKAAGAYLTVDNLSEVMLILRNGNQENPSTEEKN
jgi:putative hydrolase of the HAD superfamily